MNVTKRVCRKRQALRLHIESMKSTREHMALRMDTARHDPDEYAAAVKADRRIASKIQKAEQELAFLEEHWTW